MEKGLILWWTKTKTLTCQGQDKEEEMASAASPFVLKIIEVNSMSKIGEYYSN